jgi:hypothetical protein
MSHLGNTLPKSVILNVGVKSLLYLPFHIGAKRRSTNANPANF